MFARILAVALLLAVAVAIAARTSGGTGPERRYVVRPHDTLWSIATSRYAGDPRAAIWRIQRRNGLAGTLISPGQVLVLP